MSSPLNRFLPLFISIFTVSFAAVLDVDPERWSAPFDLKEKIKLASLYKNNGRLQDSTVRMKSPKATATATPTPAPFPSPGFHPGNSYAPIKTILFNDNEAEHNVDFMLALKPGDDFASFKHEVNATDIITSTLIHQVNHAGRVVTKNFTLVHRFEGTAGVANYKLVAQTKSGWTFTISGTYFVAGIVVSDFNDPDAIVSGIDSKGVSVKTLSELKAIYKRGYIPLGLAYEEVGPDVNLNAPSLADALKTVRVTVEPGLIGINGKGSSKSTVIQYDPSCNPHPMAFTSPEGVVTFKKPACGVAFDHSSKTVYIKLIPNKYLSSIVKIQIPAIEVNGEAFQTDVKVYVKKPIFPPPNIVLSRPITMVFDHFGNEVISLNLSKTIKPDQEDDASEVYLSLPDKRYAKADPKLSSYVQPIQKVTFVIVMPGSEDAKVTKRIDEALRLSQKKQGKVVGSSVGIRDMYLPNVSRPNSASQRNFTKAEMALSWNSIPMIAARQEDPATGYKSSILVEFPSKGLPVVANNPSGQVISTSFASTAKAIEHPLSFKDGFHHLLVTLKLKGFSKEGYSEHKSGQIAKSLAANVDKLYKPMEEASTAYLTKAAKNGDSLDVVYVIQIPGIVPEVKDEVSKTKKEISKEIARDVYLKEDSVMIEEAKLIMPGGSGNFNGIGTQSQTTMNGVSGWLIGAIIVLVLIVSLPLCALCFGFFVLRREKKEADSSNMTNDDSLESPGSAGAAAGASLEPTSDTLPTPTTKVEKDSFGRADRENYESFKMEKEMFDQGYYNDKNKS